MIPPNDDSPAPAISRRDFAVKSALGMLGLGAGLSAAADTMPAGGGGSAAAARGIYKIIRNPKVLEAPLGMPAGETWRYMLPVPFQIAPGLAAAHLNLKMCGGPGQDFEGGLDLITFGSLADLRPERAVPVARIHVEPNPHNDGKPCRMVPYPGLSGFVPFGAKQADGRPHPHAGTGFLTVVTAAWPMDASEGFATYPDRIGLTAYWGTKRYRTIELYQLTCDGKNLTLGKPVRLQAEEIAPGYKALAPAMGDAVAEGEDLLTGLMALRNGATTAGSGLLRWQRINGAWRPVSYEAVTPEDGSLEPSVVRDLDGSLLVCARGIRKSGPPLRIWRQARPGDPWELKINLQRLLPSAPVGLGRAVDGTPYVAGSFYQPEFKLPEGLYSDGGISRLEPVGWRGERSTICVWSLNAARDGFDAQFIARDPRSEFGLPPQGTIWAADHPQSAPVQLADGQWHALMGYRMLEWKENTHFILPPSPQTGAYLDEIVSFGPPAPPWNF